MRLRSLLPALAALAATLFSAPAAAQIQPDYSNAVTCALIYRYLGDRGPAYDRLVAKSAELGGRTEADIRADLDAREPRLVAAIADGRLQAATMADLGADACPKTFAVAPARPRAPANAPAAPGNAVDPARCAGLARWFDTEFPANAWGSTWAGDEMVRRAASAAGLSYEAMDRQAGRFSGTGQPIPALLDEAVRCQEAYDTPVPPGAVLAAARNGDRPGIERGRIHHCQALGKSFDSNFPDIASYERAIAQNPPQGMDRLLEKVKSLEWYLSEMSKAQCPESIWSPRADAFEAFTKRGTAAAKAAKERLDREGRWW